MKQFVLFVLFSSISVSIFAQESILLNEDFDNNARFWEITNSKRLVATIAEGSYILKGKSDFSPNFFVQPLELSKEQDFEMELKITQKSGARNMGFGLVWGAKKNQDDLFTFLISANGKYTILRKERGQYDEIKPWTEDSEVIHKSGKPNIFLIQKEGNKVRHYLNGKLLFVSGYHPPRSQHAGILFHGTMKIEVDYFKVSVPDPSAREARGNH
ncbi:MAG: hypothetical protein AAF587_23060 [Bacteroidota bacterium]